MGLNGARRHSLDETRPFDAVMAFHRRKLGQEEPSGKLIERVPTGLVGLDAIIGGGMPRGRIVELYGHPGSCKTTLALEACRAYVSAGLRVALIDFERAYDPLYGAALGHPALPVLQPLTMEEGLDAAIELIRASAGAVVFDSVAAMTPEAEMVAPMSQRTVGLQAMQLTVFLRKATGLAAAQGTTLMMVNQFREEIRMGGPPRPAYLGPATTTPGGRALKFYTSLRLEVRSAGKYAEEGMPRGMSVKVRVRKNKTSADQDGEAEYVVVPGRGFCREEELLRLALQRGVMTASKGTYSWDGRRVRGRAAVMVELSDQATAETVRALVLATPAGGVNAP